MTRIPASGSSALVSCIKLYLRNCAAWMLDNFASPEARDFVSRDSQQLAHDLVGGVAQGRTKIGDAPWRFRKRRYDIGDHHLAQTFLFDVSEVPACLEMLIFENIGNAIHFSDGNLFVKAMP